VRSAIRAAHVRELDNLTSDQVELLDGSRNRGRVVETHLGGIDHRTEGSGPAA
jgi:hypothetical protein